MKSKEACPTCRGERERKRRSEERKQRFEREWEVMRKKESALLVEDGHCMCECQVKGKIKVWQGEDGEEEGKKGGGWNCGLWK